MSNRYNQVSNGNTQVHFSKALFGEVESSRMTAHPFALTTFNAGDIVPIYCREILPDESIDFSLDSVIRQTTLLTPTMGSMHVDFYAFFVPNRIVNSSWKAVEGENISGSWTAPQVSLASLKVDSSGSTQIPVGSVADYYGFPTQLPIPNDVLALCHDLKFRGYVMIWNEYFRDQNYQPPIPISYLNVYQGFLDSSESSIPLNGVFAGASLDVPASTPSDGSFAAGSVLNELYGSGAGAPVSGSTAARIVPRSGVGSFRATFPPLKANKLHDYFTSGLPSPQKSQSSIFAPVTGSVGIPQLTVLPVSGFDITGAHPSLRWRNASDGSVPPAGRGFLTSLNGETSYESEPTTTAGTSVYPSNLATLPTSSAQVEGLALSVDDIRMASAIQQYYEILARGGSRYREQLSSLFGLEVDDPFSDIPSCLGHISRDLELYQTAQTSPSESGSTPQGNLAGFGYTSTGGHLFSHRFIEHGYLHVFAVVRHRNIYSSYMARDNFRLNALDFYIPTLANISEQPIYTREINPFSSNRNGGFAFQEAWAEYRYEPDTVSGYMRPGITDDDNNSVSLALWNYADPFDSGLNVLTGSWLRSNSQLVLDRTLAVQSLVESSAPQFKAQFVFHVDKTLPMPVYSVPGMDII